MSNTPIYLASIAALALGILAVGSPALSQTRDAETRHAAAEAAARQALQTFITQWNTAEDANLRRAMHFPFVTVPGGGALVVDDRPQDFSAGFDQMREREGWRSSSFDFDSFTVVRSSPEKVHAEVGFSRYGADGAAYRTSRVFYIVTRRDDRWAIQLRTPAAEPEDLGDDERTQIVASARQAVLDFFTAFNTGDVDGTLATLNHPHLFMTPGGGFAVAESPADGPRPDFDRMRADEDWHMSTLDELQASIVTRNKVHFELTFTRWHPDGTRYLTVPALWIVTRAEDHWGIQVRSLMPPTFDARAR
ncbi:MAG: hypothetical protein OXF93_17030 [Acidobacteria bacterium]|nr:hypothetical protein [Acidobacteriota bacterium]